MNMKFLSCWECDRIGGSRILLLLLELWLGNLTSVYKLWEDAEADAFAWWPGKEQKAMYVRENLLYLNLSLQQKFLLIFKWNRVLIEAVESVFEHTQNMTGHCTEQCALFNPALSMELF